MKTVLAGPASTGADFLIHTIFQRDDRVGIAEEDLIAEGDCFAVNAVNAEGVNSPQTQGPGDAIISSSNSKIIIFTILYHPFKNTLSAFPAAHA